MAALEAEAQAAAEQAKAEDRKHPGVPDDQAQRNFTDAESRIMPAPGGRDFLQAYNCQAVVDHTRQVIVAARATSQSSDKQQAVGMIEEAISNTGAVPKEVSADAGYYSAKAVEGLSNLGVDPYVASEQTRHGRVVPPAPRGRIPKHLSPRDRSGASCRPGGVANVTRCGWRRWSRSSARSSRDGASGSSSCGAWKRSRASGRSSAPATTLNQVQGRLCSNCSAPADWPPDEHGPPG